MNDPSRIRNTAHVDFNDEKQDNNRHVEGNSLPAVREALTQKFYVDEFFCHNVDDSSSLALDPDEKLKLDGQDSTILSSTLTSPKMITEIPTKSCVDILHENNRNRRDFSSVFNNQDNEFDENKLTNLILFPLKETLVLITNSLSKNMLTMN